MTQYLLSMYQPEVLGKIMQELDGLASELRAAGAWVFSITAPDLGDRAGVPR
jgi:hypothetical protein